LKGNSAFGCATAKTLVAGGRTKSSFPKSLLNMLPKPVASVGLAGADFTFPKGEGFGMVLSHAREGSVRPDLFSFSLKLARKGILGYRWNKDSP
jgi:hypothetical protein